MDDLVQWLLAQLDEDERIARGCSGTEWWEHPKNWVSAPQLNRIAVVMHDGDRAHIIRHDPRRMLREIDAKRRVLAIHRPYVPEPDQACLGCAGGIMFTSCPVVRLLALPYADRAGYREEWRP
jgi:hypothetical protein